MLNPSNSLRPESHIGAGIVIKGEVFSEEDLRIDGCLEGGLELAGGRLTVGPEATVKADVKGGEILILGKLRGNINAERRVAIGANGELVGNIRTPSITIDEDAYYKGNIDIVRPEPQTADDAPQAARAAAVASGA